MLPEMCWKLNGPPLFPGLGLPELASTDPVSDGSGSADSDSMVPSAGPFAGGRSEGGRSEAGASFEGEGEGARSEAWPSPPLGACCNAAVCKIYTPRHFARGIP